MSERGDGKIYNINSINFKIEVKRKKIGKYK